MINTKFILNGEFSEFEELIKEKFNNTKHVLKGEIIIKPEESRSSYYYVVKGLASFYLRHESGGIKISSLRGEGTIFPLYYSFESTTVEKSLEIIALTDMELIQMSRSELHDLMIEHPTLALAMSDAYGKYSTLLLYEISNLLFDSSFVRVCNFLLTQSLSEGSRIKATHEDIAIMTGLTRATVSRILGSLKQSGIIALKRSSIDIISIDALQGLCSFIANPNIDK